MNIGNRQIEQESQLQKLVVLSQDGDRATYHDLLTMLAPLLRRLLYKSLAAGGQQHAVEDIVQETLLAIHLKLQSYDRNQPFMAWLRIVAKHKMIDFLRRQKNNSVSIDDENFGELADTIPPESLAARDLDILLSQLRPPAGDIIYALKIEGASIREVAEKFSLTESNVKVLVHRGLEKLSQLVLKTGMGTT